VSYNRFVEREREVAIPLALFIKKVLLSKYTGISFVDKNGTMISVKILPTCITGEPRRSLFNILMFLIHGIGQGFQVCRVSILQPRGGKFCYHDEQAK